MNELAEVSAITNQLTEAQQTFLKNYRDLLTEVESAVQFVSECYSQGDEDIGDRLLKSVTQGLTPYNEENLTMQSIFLKDEIALKTLKKFQDSVQSALIVDEAFFDEQERTSFLHEMLFPKEKKWKSVVENYITTNEIRSYTNDANN